MLNTPTSYREDFRQFRIRVLEYAINDITKREGASLKFAFETVKEGRAGKVKKILFLFSEKLIMEKEKKDALAKDKIFLEGRIQGQAAKCFRKYGKYGRKCVPNPKKDTCQYCTTKGAIAIKAISQTTPMSEAEREALTRKNLREDSEKCFWKHKESGKVCKSFHHLEAYTYPMDQLCGYCFAEGKISETKRDGASNLFT